MLEERTRVRCSARSRFRATPRSAGGWRPLPRASRCENDALGLGVGRVPDRRGPGPLLDGPRDAGIVTVGGPCVPSQREALPGVVAAAGILDRPRVVDRAAGRVEIRVGPHGAELSVTRPARLAGRRVDARSVVRGPGDVVHGLVAHPRVVHPSLDDLDALQVVAGGRPGARVRESGDEEGRRDVAWPAGQVAAHRNAGRVGVLDPVRRVARVGAERPPAEEPRLDPRSAGPDERYLSLAPELLNGLSIQDVSDAFMRASASKQSARVDVAHIAPITASVTDAMFDLINQLQIVPQTLTFKVPSRQVSLYLGHKKDNIQAIQNMYGINTVLIKQIGDQEKLQLIEVLWEIILSDNELHDFETNLIRRLAGLLYISDVECGNAKIRAAKKEQN